MVVWVVTIPIFWYTTLHLARLNGWVRTRPVALASDYHTVVVTAWYLTIATLIGERFWDYWSTLLP